MGIIWTIIIGFVAGVIAKFIMPGPNEPQGFVLTAILGIVGAFVASFLGQMLGWYGPGEGAGLIGAVIGAIIVLFVYGYFAGRKMADLLAVRSAPSCCMGALGSQNESRTPAESGNGHRAGISGTLAPLRPVYDRL